MCPHCGRDAPIVYRGVVPYCTACGGVRLPLSAPSVNLAGRPSRVGGAVASAAGGLVIVTGLGLSLMLGGVLYALATVALALAVAVPLAAVALALGLALWLGGRRLERAGVAERRATVEDALLQLAEERGAISAADAARSLGLTSADADARLTDVAKRRPDRLAVDLDDQGGIWYRALSAGSPARSAPARVEEARPERPRVAEPRPADSGAPGYGELEARELDEPGREEPEIGRLRR